MVNKTCIGCYENRERSQVGFLRAQCLTVDWRVAGGGNVPAVGARGFILVSAMFDDLDFP